jgi:hypothetical protein
MRAGRGCQGRRKCRAKQLRNTPLKAIAKIVSQTIRVALLKLRGALKLLPTFFVSLALAVVDSYTRERKSS